MRIWAGLLLLVGCSERVLPPNLGGEPFWYEVDLSDANDLGHTPEARSVDAPGPITLVDVTEQAGLSDAIGGGNSHGVGIAFVDVTGDALPDIFVANGVSERLGQFPSKLYANQGDGTFVDVTTQWGLDFLATKDCFSVAAADFDQDGDTDIYLGTSPTDLLLRNEGDHFVDGTAAASAGGPVSPPERFRDGRSKVVAFGDYDGDGWLDLVSSSSALPDPFVYLLRNRGDGTFVDVTEETGAEADPNGNPCAVMWSDYDNDRDPDLWIWNDRGDHILLRNEAGERFFDATSVSDLDQVRITHPMGIDSADIDHDGDLDYYIANIRNNPLLRNNGDGTFSDITSEAGTGGRFGWGLAFEDFDLDGWADIFVAQEDNLPHLLFHNTGEVPSRFEEIEVDHIDVLNTGAAHNTAAGFADYDGDGLVDVVVAETDGSRITLYRNETDVADGRYLHVASDAIGGRVLVQTGPLVQFRDLKAGSSRASQNQHSVRFGLGEWTGADVVTVQWPSGEQVVFTNVEGDQTLVVERP